jgi:hypothetical protein
MVYVWDGECLKTQILRVMGVRDPESVDMEGP